MASFNRVTIIGNLTRDPQLKHLPSNTIVAEFGIAMSRRYKTAGGEECEDVCFVDCAAFGKQAEIIQEYCKKGKPLFVEGRLKYDVWEAKDGGGKRSKLSVVVENFQFLGARESDGDEADQRQRQPARPVPGQRPQREMTSPPFGDEQQFKEDDIPFAWSGRDTQPL